MAELVTKYTDVKNITHNVIHISPAPEDNFEREQLTEEIIRVLTRKRSNTIVK